MDVLEPYQNNVSDSKLKGINRIPDQILVNLFVWMPSWPGVWKPVIRITNGGVHSPIIHHLHSPVSLVGQLSRNFVLNVKQIFDNKLKSLKVAKW